ncbi:ABC transporter ATP-binding protein/permease [Flavobacteriaceae bacterium]|nr:ABC transporter ATP-binding protein/permease [Flavobacteriaceae bacterium]
MISTLKKINFLITKRQRKGLVILTLLLFIGMFLEIFGLGILIPTISIILDPEITDKTPHILPIRNFFSEFSDLSFVFIFLGALVLVYLIKSVFIVFLTHKQNRFLSNIIAYISNNLFTNYMNQSYSFHLNRNASELFKNIQIEIAGLSVFLQSLITLFIEGGFTISVLATLIYIEPIGALSIGLFYGLLSISFFQFTKNNLKTWGKKRQDLDSETTKIALEGLGGIKDLLILGKTSFFTEMFSIRNYMKARVNSNHITISQLPRFYLELLSIIGLVSFIVLLLFQGKDTTSLISILGVFVAATFRMIPSLNRIIGGVQSMKYYRPSLDIIYKELKIDTGPGQAALEKIQFNFQNEIKLENIRFSFNEDRVILKDINLKIKKGQTIGIIGESGSGKSTLIDLIIGLHKPTSGQILIDGVSGFQIDQQWRKKIGYVSQSIYLIDDTIKNNIALGVQENEIIDLRINELLKQVQLEEFISNLKFGVNTKVGERGVQLSGGQRQRIGIARALYHDPDVIILDEATSALDNETERDLMESFNNLIGVKTIIMIAHRMTTLKDCDFIYKIEKGEGKQFTE